MKKILFSLMLVVVATAANAQNRTYPATLKKYLEVSGSMDAFKTAITQMMGSFKNMNASVPNEIWTELENELKATSMDDLVTMLSPVYEKHMTETDLNEIIKFYGTPVGRRMAEKTPAIMQESMQAGQSWGQGVAQKVMTKLKEKGY